jgi:hypothetical protein
MESKLNCWEYKKCGREPGGLKNTELGICPAATTVKLNKTNSGKNGGRSCWALAGTLCGGTVQGIFAHKFQNCMGCDFYKVVLKEEIKTSTLEMSKQILEKLK